MSIIGLFDDLTRWLRGRFNGIDDSISTIYVRLKDNMNRSLSNVESSLKTIMTNSTEMISSTLETIVESISNIDFSNLNILNFDALKEPFEGISEYFLEFLFEVLKENGMSALSGLLGKSSNLNTMPIASESAHTWEKATANLNENFSTIFGIKPFNIIFGKDSWVDESKTGLYYDIMRQICFVIILMIIAMPMIQTFFSALTVQKTKEYYEFSKLSIQEYVKLHRRNFTDLDKLKDMANHLGYDLECLDDVIKVSEYFPSVSDLTTFAVREAFDDIEKLFIYDGNEIPVPFITYGKQIGMPLEWIQKFWHSHWRLLGSDQVLEAFHRKFISKDDLLDYLRRLDYVEKDRKVIMDMSYNLLTRVDVRRIYAQGLISSNDLIEYYSKLGFTIKDSELMTQMSKQMRFIDNKDFRDFYLKRFLEGFMTHDELVDNLTKLGYEIDEIAKFYALNIQKRELDYKVKLKDRIVELFFNDSIDFDDFVSRMKKLGLSSHEIEWIDNLKDVSLFKSIKLPTITELKRYMKKGIIDMTSFVYYAIRLGYEKDVIFYILRDLEII